ncbi:MAG: hypothetical protein JXK07_09740 [Spirochaetes bacterium]|nr:hypothetical protein [Spirochaetota bacterium]MBN2769453.1 hypothetical protein [Spirochaetota bacterium]
MIFPKSVLLLSVLTLTMTTSSCGSSGSDSNGDNTPESGATIAAASIATDSVLDTIPDSILTSIRDDFEVAYFHTSHGTHVSYGVFGLPDFKDGYDEKFAVSTSDEPDKLYFRDNPGGFSVSDLSNADNDWEGWVEEARTWLEDPSNASVNVFIWSWCNIANHDATAYCNSMQTLIDEYGAGGSKVGTGLARKNPVNFVFMTGHANVGSNTGDGQPKNQAAIITEFCETNGYHCIDYYSIDTTAMDGTYYEDTGDNGNSAEYGGNFYEDWQASHTEGVDWYRNRTSPGGSEAYGQHNTQHITANRKAFAFWWVMARLAGWEG